MHFIKIILRPIIKPLTDSKLLSDLPFHESFFEESNTENIQVLSKIILPVLQSKCYVLEIKQFNLTLRFRLKIY